MKILGPWVAIQPVEAMMIAGGLLFKPWEARAPHAFIGEVLAFGTEIHDPPFEVGDFVLVEQMSGCPAMATQWPDIIRPDGRRMPGPTKPVDIPASVLGGDEAQPLGLIRWQPTPELPPVPYQDEECTRRMERGAMLTDREQKRRDHMGAEPCPRAMEEIALQKRWLDAHEASREGMRRSRLMKPARDPGQGDGIVAVLTDAEDLLALGVDPDWLYGRLVAQGMDI